MTFETISLDIDGATATLTLSRPEIGNALGSQAGTEIKRAVAEVAANSSLRLLVLRGEGKAFCVGGDLGEFASMSELSPAIRSMVIDFNGASATLAGLDIPILAVVQGAVAGAGLALIGLADHVVASREATFAYAYPGIGFSADGGVTWLLPRLMGLRAFQTFATGGERWAAEQALLGGLVSEVVAAEDLEATAEARAMKMASGPTLALGAIRRLALDGYGLPFSAQLARETDEICRLAKSEDARSAIQAALARQRPQFTGR